jgi:hypothetical protein
MYPFLFKTHLKLFVRFSALLSVTFANCPFRNHILKTVRRNMGFEKGKMWFGAVDKTDTVELFQKSILGS